TSKWTSFFLAERTGYRLKPPPFTRSRKYLRCFLSLRSLRRTLRLLLCKSAGSNPAVKKKDVQMDVIFPGGENRIRTCGTIARTHAFQACSFNHSDTSPY